MKFFVTSQKLSRVIVSYATRVVIVELKFELSVQEIMILSKHHHCQLFQQFLVIVKPPVHIRSLITSLCRLAYLDHLCLFDFLYHGPNLSFVFVVNF